MLTQMVIRPTSRWVSSIALLGMITLSGSGTAYAQAMRHPGAFDSASQFAEIAQAVRQNRQPWAASFARMRTNAHDNPGYQPRPVEVLVRGTAPGHPAENYATLFNDAAAAYALALDWRLTGDTQRAARATAILNAWAGTLKTITGTSDKYLASGLYGYQLAVAAETLRDFPGWQPRDRQEFARLLLTVFASMNVDFLAHHNGAAIDHYWANWDLANVASLVAIGVFADRRDLYERGRDYYLHGSGNGAILHAAWKTYPGGLAQWQESGRDQGHALLGIGLAGTICQIAWQQRDDLFGAYDNRLLAAVRYVARYNLGGDVPYTPYTNSDVTQPVISDKGRGEARPIWSLLVAHYVQLKHLAAPELVQAAAQAGPDGGGGDYGPNSGGFDELGYGTLTFTMP
ncbi:alginate lyase family protein [Methylobacterium sp. J-068]|uniref:alginate lyase family protein n=1 Tax=Methylobacterium sp. J-068 TaxID=2836649 RepID=UPI001FB9446A|nr:alginate lyase family protein [Methylobacterium sp. J-068]MCJ2033425.1 alginate lyase family protein [Methylobacterium sp. J-068]